MEQRYIVVNQFLVPRFPEGSEIRVPSPEGCGLKIVDVVDLVYPIVVSLDNIEQLVLRW